MPIVQMLKTGLICSLGFAPLASVALLTSCMQEEEQETFEAEQEQATASQQKANRRTPTSEARSLSARELVSIPVIVREKPAKSTVSSSSPTTGTSSQSGLNLLAAATLYTITLSGCDSGYSSTANESSTNLQAYKYDTNCLVKLTTFTFNGVAYTPKSGSDFSTWEVGDEAIFEVAADPSDTLKVIINETLEPTVLGTENIVFEFFEITQGADEEIPDTQVGDGHTMTVAGQASPSFTIDKVEFDGLTAGVPSFTFTLECTADIVGNLCIDVDMADIRYKLIEQPAGGTLSYADAQALFPADEESIDLNTEKLATNSGGTVHGGFITKSLEGPGPIHSKPDMMLVIEAADLSYLYFNVSVDVLTQD